MNPEFTPFPKLARLYRLCTITEKIDGTNASIRISETTPGEHESHSWERDGIVAIVGDLTIRAGSRTRWITPGNDNFGFASWVNRNRDELVGLGIGHHFGEWWGSGIQRGYGLSNGEKHFSLFNTIRWAEVGKPLLSVPSNDPRPTTSPKTQEYAPACCRVVPELYRDTFDDYDISESLHILREYGSRAAPGFKNPEGVVVFHTAANQAFKITLDGDGHKGAAG